MYTRHACMVHVAIVNLRAPRELTNVTYNRVSRVKQSALQTCPLFSSACCKPRSGGGVAR